MSKPIVFIGGHHDGQCRIFPALTEVRLPVYADDDYQYRYQTSLRIERYVLKDFCGTDVYLHEDMSNEEAVRKLVEAYGESE